MTGAICLDPWLDAYKWSTKIFEENGGWSTHGGKPVLILTADKGFISKVPKWRVQLEPIEEIKKAGGAKAVRFNGSDHIDVCDVPLCIPFNYKADAWFLENLWECKEFLKEQLGLQCKPAVESHLEENRVKKMQRQKTFESPW